MGTPCLEWTVFYDVMVRGRTTHYFACLDCASAR